MIDPAVERQYSDSRELLAHWRTFHDFFVMGVKGENITPEKEAQFLDIKSKIAMLHDSFMEALAHDQNIGQEVLNIISRAITLKHLSRQNQADIKKMEIEWHESYLLLNETIGLLEDKRKELAQINETQYRATKAAGVMGQKARNFFGSFYFKATVIVLAVAFGTAGVQVMGIYDYNELGKYDGLQAPYRVGKAIVHQFKPDSPWITLDSAPRKGYVSWPVGFKEPEVVADDKSKFISGLSGLPVVKENLNKATEYRKEVTSKEFKGQVEIHSFLLPDAESARALKEEWDRFAQTQEAEKRFGGYMRVARNANIVVMIRGQDIEMVNLLRDNVYSKYI